MKKLPLFVLFFVAIAFSQPTVDGSLDDAEYITIATKQNSNAGFGSNIDVSKIVYYPDPTNSFLYLGIVGKLDVTNNNGIGVWLNVTGTGSPSGKAAGQSLGIQSSGGHYIGAGNNGSNVNFKADFEVDYMFAFNPGGGSSNVYFDAAKHVTSSVIEYQGSCDQSGSSSTNSSATGTVFSQNSITFAFNNSGAANKGLELKIPFSAINATSSHSIEVFAFVVSSTAYFSDVTVPGNVTGGNTGFNADYSVLSGGSYHSTPASSLPVELTSFTANAVGKNVVLKWNTATEINNAGFEVERKVSSLDFARNSQWENIGFVEGYGTVNTPQEYTFIDSKISAGTYLYRLKQIDRDGKFEYSPQVEVTVAHLPNEFTLLQNYPNPFNPTTAIQFAIPTTQFATLKVYTALGQEVATLFSGIAEGNKMHTVEFNGSTLPSGVYFYALKTKDRNEVKKLTLLK